MMNEQPAEWPTLQSLDVDSFVVATKSKFELERIHPEAQRRLQMLGLVKINDNGEQQEATDEEIDVMLHKTYQNENPDVLADKYMMRHEMYEYLKTLTAKVVLTRPADPVNYMIHDLQQQSIDKMKV
ncbi:unnamed protein product [Adineta ricciae]|uniref:Uncharacterized protein n=1 Tax=Adineta ricciae TaxID=249248 RepID=A0A814N5R0_ADIRI|nr:unnamed protein product [Adineta ricciae]